MCDVYIKILLGWYLVLFSLSVQGNTHVSGIISVAGRLSVIHVSSSADSAHVHRYACSYIMITEKN